jgi:hypothetical protein
VRVAGGEAAVVVVHVNQRRKRFGLPPLEDTRWGVNMNKHSTEIGT